MNIHSAHEYTMFAPAELLHKWHEWQPRNQGDLDFSATGEFGRVLHGGGPDSDLIYVLKYVTVVGLCLKWYTLYYIHFIELITKDSNCQCFVNPY
jgi:hypothetical protein